MNIAKALVFATGGIGVLFLTLFFGPLATYYLWNWIVPTVFSGPVLTFWQAVATFILCRVLFGNDSVGKSSS